MSIAQMKAVWDHSPLHGTAKLIHLALADHADDSGLTWIDQHKVADKVGCSERYVRRVISRLKELGMLVVEKKGRLTRYILRIVDAVKGSEARPEDDGTGTPVPIKVEPRFRSRRNRSSYQTGTPVPTHKNHQGTTKEPSQRNHHRSAPAARGEGQDMLGDLPEDVDTRPESGEDGYAANLRGTQAYFIDQSKKHRAAGDVRRINKVLRDLNRQGYTWGQIQNFIKHFFIRYEQDIRSANRDYTAIAMFQQRQQRILNEKTVAKAPKRWKSKPIDFSDPQWFEKQRADRLAFEREHGIVR